MIKKIYLSILSILLIPLTSYAHVKWFAEPQIPVKPYSITDTPVMIAILAVLIVILIGVYLERILRVPKWYSKFTEKWAPHILSIASIGFGLSYIIFSFNGYVFAPNLPTDNFILLSIQAIAGAMFLFGFYERLAGVLLVLLFAICTKEFGFVQVMDTFEMLGFALYAIIIGRPKFKVAEIKSLPSFIHRAHEYGIPILRIGTGINLIILGFSEKILAPSLTADFLSHYHWNFMQMLGFSGYTDYWFAFSAGVSEALFGLFFLLGLVTRTTTLALAVFLMTTLYLLGPVELIGHLPHFSIAIVFLILGSGSKLKV
jgi:uncharacterized membrane protein YphA (DoxX/SURF4 family)